MGTQQVKEISKEETRALALELLHKHYDCNAASLNNLELFMLARKIQAYAWSFGKDQLSSGPSHGLRYNHLSHGEMLEVVNIILTLSWTLPEHLIVFGPAREK